VSEEDEARRFYDVLFTQFTAHLQRLLEMCRGSDCDLSPRERDRIILAWIQNAISNPYVCPGCGYDMRATRDKCPECGKNVEKRGLLHADLPRPDPLAIVPFDPATLQPVAPDGTTQSTGKSASGE
jgi:hypothetical protein